MTWYPLYAVRRFGLLEGLRRLAVYWVWSVLRGDPLRRLARRWRLRERRPKLRGYTSAKYAIDRDGDLFLVECPVCHDQGVFWDQERRVFACRGGSMNGHAFRVYLEDGVRPIRDHRKGDVREFPAAVVYDDAVKTWRLGLKRDAPWWWRRRDLYRDLHDGKDGHGHKPYVVLGTYQDVCGVQAEQRGQARPETERGGGT